MATCSVNGDLFCTVEADKNKKTQNSGVMLKVCMDNSEEAKIYGVLKEVFELGMMENQFLCFNVIGMTFLIVGRKERRWIQMVILKV